MAQAFIRAFEARYGPVGAYSAYAYEATNLAIEAIWHAGSQNRLAVLHAMQAIKDYPGVFGIQNFDERGDSRIHQRKTAEIHELALAPKVVLRDNEAL